MPNPQARSQGLAADQTPLLRHSDFAFERKNITDRRPLRSLFRDASKSDPTSAVFNLVALTGFRRSVENPDVYDGVNMSEILNLLKLCRKFGVGKLILASSSSVYGAEVNGPVSEMPLLTVLYRLARLPRKLLRRCCTRTTTFTASTTGATLFHGLWPSVQPELGF